MIIMEHWRRTPLLSPSDITVPSMKTVITIIHQDLLAEEIMIKWATTWPQETGDVIMMIMKMMNGMMMIMMTNISKRIMSLMNKTSMAIKAMVTGVTMMQNLVPDHHGSHPCIRIRTNVPTHFYSLLPKDSNKRPKPTHTLGKLKEDEQNTADPVPEEDELAHEEQLDELYVEYESTKPQVLKDVTTDLIPHQLASTLETWMWKHYTSDEINQVHEKAD